MCFAYASRPVWMGRGPCPAQSLGASVVGERIHCLVLQLGHSFLSRLNVRTVFGLFGVLPAQM